MIANSRLISIQSNQSSKKVTSSSMVGYVYEVILDEDNQTIESQDLSDEASAYVGAIRFKSLLNSTANDDTLSIAFPSTNVSTLPVKNEVVIIHRNPNGRFSYERTGAQVSPNLNSVDNTISSIFPPKSNTSENNSSDYSKVEQTGISRSSNDSSNDTDGYGDYFEANTGIHKLRLYEGDTLVQSRFGQSIRMSGYNNPNNEFSPTVIIRNGENPNTIDEENVIDTTVEEDVNNDGSIIVLGSGQYQIPFQSELETSPDSFEDYPNELTGDQIFLNTGRMILSSKTGEMIFSSKGNYGFISDGAMSIDNRLGINIRVGDDIVINAEDRDVSFNTNNGKISLGDTDIEPLVKGDALVSVLGDLIDAITQQVYATPSGPTSAGPTNVATFNKIKQDLRSILSSLNSTS